MVRALLSQLASAIHIIAAVLTMAPALVVLVLLAFLALLSALLSALLALLLSGLLARPLLLLVFLLLLILLARLLVLVGHKLLRGWGVVPAHCENRFHFPLVPEDPRVPGVSWVTLPILPKAASRLFSRLQHNVRRIDPGETRF